MCSRCDSYGELEAYGYGDYKCSNCGYRIFGDPEEEYRKRGYIVPNSNMEDELEIEDGDT